jgi:Domain of unknown function (DUF397)
MTTNETLTWQKASFCSSDGCVQIAFSKSSFSSGQGNCVEVGWGKSSFSSGNGGACVEAGEGACGMIHVRDSKLGDASPVLDFTPDEWDAFTAGIRAGELTFS